MASQKRPEETDISALLDERTVDRWHGVQVQPGVDRTTWRGWDGARHRRVSVGRRIAGYFTRSPRDHDDHGYGWLLDVVCWTGVAAAVFAVGYLIFRELQVYGLL